MVYDISKVREARMKLGWNQTRLAFKCRLSVATVSFVESGKRQTPAAMAEMVKALNRGLRSAGEPPLVLADLVVSGASDPPKKRKRPHARSAA